MTTRESSDALEIQPMIIGGETFASPTSFAQERLWFLDQFEPNSALYNITLPLRIKGNISLPALQSSINTLVDRHETLRTIFGTEDGHPIQIIFSKLQLPMILEDKTGLSPAEQDEELSRLLKIEFQIPFDLAHGPLARVHFVKLAENDYGMILTFHHIIFDGWSVGIFFKELNQIYTAIANDRPVALPELEIQYADFASWQKEWLHGSTLEHEMAFWKQHLDGAPGLIELPTDRPRPVNQTFHGANEKFELSQEMTEKLESLNRKQQSTMFMTMIAAFEILLSRYCGQKDFVIGTPIAGRTRVELEPLIGFFANTLVLRADLTGNPTFIDLLRHVRDVALNAFTHQNVPFEKLVEELQPERSLSYNPLFQVMFTYQNTPDQEIELASFDLSPIETERVLEKFDLSFSCWKDGNVLKGNFGYNTDLFDAATITRMHSNFVTLLQGIAAQPEQQIDFLPLLSAAEQHQLVEEWNATAADIPHQCAHQIIAGQAGRVPAAIAVECDRQTLTYSALEQRSNQLARYLQRLGVAADQPVGLCVNRSPDMIVAMLGILKAGGAYVPLDPDYPDERLNFMAGDAGFVVMVAEASTAQKIPAFTGSRVVIDADWDVIAREDNTPPANRVHHEHLAYIIYTSGSTGVPKGVQITHGALVNFLESMRIHPGMTSSDVGLALTSISFDIAGLEIYLPLTLGCRMVLVSRDAAMDAIQLANIIDATGVTVLQATPASWRALINAGWRGNPRLKILCGGEALTRDLAQSLLERGASVWNMYGPTETTIWSTICHVLTTENNIPIGRPIANTQIYILDSYFQPVPIGAIGEVYIGGSGLARGYRHRSDLTSERFIPNPFVAAPDARIYSTGDAARYRQDGSIEYIGRLDTQVKVRGFRIELGEIEAILGTYPGIKQAVVIVREDAVGDQRITAYLTTHGAEISVNDMRAHLQARLPAYMIPAAIVVLEAFPLTPNGKVDRRALPAPESNSASDRVYVAPGNPEEVALAEIWSDLLGIEQVGAEDNFFELGGHSLLATQMMSRVRDVLHVEIPLRALFESPTVAALAVAIVHAKEQSSEQKMAPIARSARRTFRDA